MNVNRQPNKPWPDANIELLRDLWAKGATSREIGRALRRSPCSVIGKAHRLGLSKRPSPIRPRAEAGRPPRPQPLAPGASTLPPLALPPLRLVFDDAPPIQEVAKLFEGADGTEPGRRRAPR